MATETENRLTDFAKTATEQADALAAERELDSMPPSCVNEAMIMRLDATAKKLSLAPQYFALWPDCRDLVMDASALIDEIAETRAALANYKRLLNEMLVMQLKQITDKPTYRPQPWQVGFTKDTSAIVKETEAEAKRQVDAERDAKLAWANAPENQPAARAITAHKAAEIRVPPMFMLHLGLQQRFDNLKV